MSDDRLPLETGRNAFGVDAEAYDRARPPYPDELYTLLDAEALIEGCDVLEIGAGTGAATLELARRGARRILAVEPDERLAALLARKAEQQAAPVEISVRAFEDMPVPDGEFDLVVSATAFHWIDEQRGLALAMRALRPGGAIALWWMVFGDPERDDPFHEATKDLLAFGVSSPSGGVRPGVPHALDVEARTRALAESGFTAIRHERWRRPVRFSAHQIRDLYGTFSQNQSLPPDERDALLDDIEGIAQRDFGGVVERLIVTALYLARRAE